MTDAGKQILQMMTAAASILLMGACGVQLWFRLTRLMRGQETADGLAKKQSSIPLRQMAWAAGIALLSRLAAMLLAYGFYRVLGVGELSFADSFEQLWLHWDTRHYIGIAQDGYTAVGDERLRLVFFPLYPAADAAGFTADGRKSVCGGNGGFTGLLGGSGGVAL